MKNEGLILLNLYALIILCILSVIFFSKKRLSGTETKIYGNLLINGIFTIIIGLILGLILEINISMQEKLIIFFNKIYLFGLQFTISIFALYTYNISKIGKLKFEASRKIFLLLNFINAILIYILPLNIDLSIGLTTGPSMFYTFFICALLYLFLIILMIIDFRNIRNKKYIPIILLILEGSLIVVIQILYPSLNYIINPSMVITFMIMYFTIENPDVKMINQLLRNQELVEEQIESKSRFLFEMSQDIKQPTNNILGLVNNYDYLSNEDKKDAVKIIGENANELLFKLNNVLNVSSMDASKIKIVKEEYNPKMLLNGIKIMATNAIGEKPIKLNFEVSNSLPDKLSGDDVRLKQIIMSIIYNCVNHTEKGVINVSVDSIVRYDVARLLIRIEDTGTGMDLDTINRILDDNQELDKIDIEKIDRLDVDLKVVVKIIKLLGGNILIKSDQGRGSTFDIVLNQKCEMENLANSKELEKYTSDAFGKKRVLVVDDNKEELFKISDILGKKDININTSMIGKECVDRIRSGEIYNLIIIDDELKITSAYNVLKELNSLEKFKIPVIIMLEKDKEYLKKHYIEDGFKDVILKEYLNDELERISNSYL